MLYYKNRVLNLIKEYSFLFPLAIFNQTILFTYEILHNGYFFKYF